MEGEWYGIKFIFDMRGWWVDEKMESGHWNGFIYKQVYKVYKKIEKALFVQADFVVSLTYAGKNEILRLGLKTEQKIGVVPTCVDFDIFKAYNEQIRIDVRNELAIPSDAKVMIHSGSLGGNYSALDLKEIFRRYSLAFPGAYLLILSKESLSKDLSVFSDTPHVICLSSPFKSVHRYLMASDLGFVFYTLSYSVIGRSPTKLGEYWACGVPVVSYSGIGDLDYIFERYPQGGGLIKEKESVDHLFSNPSIIQPDKRLLRTYAIDYFDVEKGCIFYQNIYKNLLSQKA